MQDKVDKSFYQPLKFSFDDILTSSADVFIKEIDFLGTHCEVTHYDNVPAIYTFHTSKIFKPEFIKLLYSFDLVFDPCSVFVVTPSNHTGLMHIDNFTEDEFHKVSLHLDLTGVGVLNFFQIEDSVPVNKKMNNINYFTYELTNNDELQPVATMSACKRVTLVKTDIPHRAGNPTPQTRIILTSRFLKNPDYTQVRGLLKDYWLG